MNRVRIFTAAAVFAALAAAPAQATATKVGTLGHITFAANASNVSAAATTTLRSWLPSLRAASAIRVEVYGGTSSVKRATAVARANARAKAVKAWLLGRGISARVTVVNKVWWTGRSGADKGNRVVLVITALRPVVVPTSTIMTLSFTSDYANDPGMAPTCNYTPTSAQVTLDSAVVASNTVFNASATSACTWTASLNAVPLNKSLNVNVGFLCNESADGIPDAEVCSGAATMTPGATVTPVDDVNSTIGLNAVTLTLNGSAAVAVGVTLTP